MRHKIFWTLAAAVHLLLTAVGAAHLDFPWLGPGASALAVYGDLSGSSTSYGFFAPDITSVLRARFEITDERGSWKEDHLDAGVSRESQLRIGSLVSSIGMKLQDEKARRRTAASWAAKMFARYPTAKNVRVVLEDYELPSLVEFPKNKQRGWRKVYHAAFARKVQRSE